MEAGKWAEGSSAAGGARKPLRPLTLTQLMPTLNGIATENAKFTYTALKRRPKERQTSSALPRTVEKIHIFTLAELNACRMLDAIKGTSPAGKRRPPLSAKKPRWNSSVKRDNKRTFFTTTTLKDIRTGESKHTAVRKVLDFQQPKPKVVHSNIPRPSMRHVFASPKCLKNYKKSNVIMQHLKNKNIRISGIFKFADTPLVNEKKEERVKTMTENITGQVDLAEMSFAELTERNAHNESYRQLSVKEEKAPLTTASPHTNSETSFLQRESETCTNSSEKMEHAPYETPIISTPFKAYRNVHEYFNESSDFDLSVPFRDSTIMQLDTDVIGSRPEISTEESEIASLCDLMDKAKFGNMENIEKSEGDLRRMKTELVQEIERLKKQRRMIGESLTSHKKMLETIIKLLNQNNRQLSETAVPQKPPKTPGNIQFDYAGSKSCKPALQRSAKSPTFVIPKRTPCLRRNILHGSMPKDLNVEIGTPTGERTAGNQAFNVYMKMKQQCEFLLTPVGSKRRNNTVGDVPTTPAVTSLNLQHQLDRLYNGTP